MSFKDYYNILGLKSNKVTIDEIKIAYREQAKKYHPDMHIGDNFSEDKFKDINEAYKVLSDTKSRKRYDRNWHTYTQRKKKIESNQKEEKKTLKDRLLEMFFGITTTKTKQKNNKKLPLNGENIDTDVEVSILEPFLDSKN